MKVLAIFGASGHGKVIADTALNSGWNKVLFFDDAWPQLKKIGTWDVIGGMSQLLSSIYSYDAALVAIGDNFIRQEKVHGLEQIGIPLATIIHPRATISSFSTVGEGSVVLAGAVVNCDSKIGKNCIINTGANVDHDCILEDSVHISPGACLAGQVRVGSLSWIGMGANIKQQVIIGSQVIIGAGAVIIRPVDDCCTMVGIPGKLIEK